MVIIIIVRKNKKKPLKVDWAEKCMVTSKPGKMLKSSDAKYRSRLKCHEKLHQQLFKTHWTFVHQIVAMLAAKFFFPSLGKWKVTIVLNFTVNTCNNIRDPNTINYYECNLEKLSHFPYTAKKKNHLSFIRHRLRPMLMMMARVRYVQVLNITLKDQYHQQMKKKNKTKSKWNYCEELEILSRRCLLNTIYWFCTFPPQHKSIMIKIMH